MSDAMSEKDLTVDVDQFEQSVDPESLTGVKFMLEAVRLEAERTRKEAGQLRRALAYLNYSSKKCFRILFQLYHNTADLNSFDFGSRNGRIGIDSGENR